MRATVENVPHVHGNSSLSIWELMEVALGVGLCGCEKSWTARNLPGFEVLGTSDVGDVWKGPIQASSQMRVKGPI
jgi:hypothetical protein